jgi:hypothetical protein
MTPTVSQVATGAQSVSYSPALPGGSYGLALARANWHRSFTTAVSVPLESPMAEARRDLDRHRWEVEL